MFRQYQNFLILFVALVGGLCKFRDVLKLLALHLLNLSLFVASARRRRPPFTVHSLY